MSVIRIVNYSNSRYNAVNQIKGGYMELCKFYNECGHASEDPAYCDSTEYCSYRILRFKTGPTMPPETKAKIKEIIDKGGE